MFYGYFGDLGDLFARSKSTKPDLCQAVCKQLFARASGRIERPHDDYRCLRVSIVTGPREPDGFCQMLSVMMSDGL